MTAPIPPADTRQQAAEVHSERAKVAASLSAASATGVSDPLGILGGDDVAGCRGLWHVDAYAHCALPAGHAGACQTLGYQDEDDKPLPGLASSSPALPEPPAPSIDAKHLARQRAWSEQTFGPGPRTAGVVDHIRKELLEVEADPTDLGEWVDVVILALDGAWRAGHGPQAIIDAIRAKQARNEARTWPDWRTAPADRAIEHVRAAADVAEEQQP